MTTTPPSGVTFAHAAAMLAGHLADHVLPESMSLTVTTSYGHSTATAQLRANAVPGLAADLIAWADTLGVVTVEAWRPPEHDRGPRRTPGRPMTSPATGGLRCARPALNEYASDMWARRTPHHPRGATAPRRA